MKQLLMDCREKIVKWLDFSFCNQERRVFCPSYHAILLPNSMTFYVPSKTSTTRIPHAQIFRHFHRAFIGRIQLFLFQVSGEGVRHEDRFNWGTMRSKSRWRVVISRTAVWNGFFSLNWFYCMAPWFEALNLKLKYVVSNTHSKAMFTLCNE